MSEETKRGAMPLSARIFWIGLACFGLYALTWRSDGPPKTASEVVAERYRQQALDDPLAFTAYGTWRTDIQLDLLRALVASNVQGCGDYRWKQSPTERDEYAVQCTRDGKTWRTYLVWPNLRKASGPYRAPLGAN